MVDDATSGRRVLLALVAALAACGSSTAPASQTKRVVPPAKQIETALLPVVQVRGEPATHRLGERMSEYKIAGVSVAVFDNYELVWAHAYGWSDFEARRSAHEKTTYLAGSISKSVNALAQLMAVADGRLSLDAPINDALASWKLPDNELTRATPVTLRMLLSHTGGVTVHGFRGYAQREEVPTILQILDGSPPANSAPIRVDLAPGTRFRYAGGGTLISQLAITERTQQPYAQLLERGVLRPLGMLDSSFEQALSPARMEYAAAGYDANAAVIDGQRFRYPEMAAAGLWTTPSDLARFFIEIQKARAGRSQVISKAIADQMTTKVMDVPGLGAVGLGVFLTEVNGVPHFGHPGADVGFVADAIASLEGGRGIVIMSNSENGARLFPEIQRTIFAAYGWPGAPAMITRVPLEPALRAKLVGRYVIGDAPVEVLERGGKLVSRIPFVDGGEVVPISASEAVDLGDGARWPRPDAVRATSEHPLFLLEDGKREAAVAALRALPRAEEARVNRLGYRVLPADPAKAATILALAVDAYPTSANAQDSLAEALVRAGKHELAISAYQRVLAIVDADPQIAPVEKATYKARANAELAKLRGR